jgi:hypothetical protein
MGAYIRRDGVRLYLGLFDTAEGAYAAYVDADARNRANQPDPLTAVLNAVRALYVEHGPKALPLPSLNAAGFRPRLLRSLKLKHADLLAGLGLAEEYALWKTLEGRKLKADRT